MQCGVAGRAGEEAVRGAVLGFPQPTSASGNVCKSDENHSKRAEGSGVQA